MIVDFCRTINYQPSEGDSLSPPFHYNAELNKNVYYTFCRLEYYSQGQTVNFQTDVLNGLEHVLNVFSQISPESYSWSAVSNGTHASLGITIPQSGFYYVLVRSYNPAEWGTCNLTINNDRRFENVPVNSSKTCIPLPSSRDIFTCFAKSEIGNPVILLMDSVSGRVLAYNDDYPYIPTSSDYDWGTNARINGAFSQGQWLFTTSYSYPCEQIFDIYTGLWTRSALPYFPNMKDDDTICSSLATGNYNCISWAMGEWLVGFWLGYFNEVSESGVWYEDALDSLFNAYGYTRENTTASNSMVDLWKGIDSHDGYMKCTHASIKSKANQYAAGYDWESKIGDEIRIFHPRYALEGYKYGEVFAHYRKGHLIPHDSLPIIINPILLNASLNQEEINTIKKGVTSVPRGALSEFDALYDECKKNGSLSVSISIDEFEGVEPYHDLLLVCKNVPVLRYLLYERICSQDILAMKLLKDLTLADNRGIWEKVREQTLAIKKEHSSINAVMPIQTKALLLVKALLASENRESCYEVKDAITYSSNPVVDVSCKGTHLTIIYQLHADANVSLMIGTVDGSFITPLINRKQQEEGQHQVSYTVPKPGVYTIGLIANGCVYKKKITVK